MTRSRHISARPEFAASVGLISAAIVSIAALAWSGGPERRLPLSPFGWHRIIIIQAMSTLMLSWSLARILAGWSPFQRPRAKAVFWLILGLTVTVGTLAFGTVVELVVDSNGAGFLARLLIRVLWCLALQTPWCLLGLMASQVLDKERPSQFSTGNLFALAVITAIGLPASFLFIFLDQQTQAARSAWQQTQLVKARLLVQRLYDTGSTASLGERNVSVGTRNVVVEVTPAMALADLGKACGFVERQIDELASLEGSVGSDRLTLARYYVAMDRFDEAETTLEPMAFRDPVAALELAKMLKEQRRVEESRDWAEKTLAQVEQTRSVLRTDAAAIQMSAYDILVVLAGERADYQAAERYLLDALQRLPKQKASIHDRLAKHYEFTGQLAKSHEHQQLAAQAAPADFAPPESLLTKMLSTGAPVGLARPKSSRYK